MLEQNTTYNLKIVEKYLIDLYMNVQRRPAIMPVWYHFKESKYIREIISDFLLHQIDKLTEQIAEKEKN